MKNKKVKTLKTSNGITLIALVITIIVLLILAGISIAMLSGNNGILSRATNAKKDTDNAQIKERINLAYHSAFTTGLGKLDENELANEMKTEFKDKLVNNELPSGWLDKTSVTGKWRITIDGVYLDVPAGSENIQNSTGVTLGQAYQPTWIGKPFTYTAGPTNAKISEWIIIGQESNGDMLITTTNPIGSYTTNATLTDWINYEKNLNEMCSVYEGTIKDNISVKLARSITLDDINRAVGFTFPETFNEFTFCSTNDFTDKKVNYCYPDEENKVLVNPTETNNIWNHRNDSYFYYNDNGTYYYALQTGDDIELPSNCLTRGENMKYIFADDSEYFVASRLVAVDENQAFFSVSGVGYDMIGTYLNIFYSYNDHWSGETDNNPKTMKIRPIVVLSADIDYDDVKDCIGDSYVSYE